MPTYTYKCDNHKEPLRSYEQRSITEAERIPNCLDCKQPMKRVFEAVPTWFSGTGFYSTDKDRA
jgi:predicted nucleic acid-binding Zn ribbon protein